MSSDANVGQLAKSKAKLPLNEDAVIGVFTGPGGDTALIRTRDGKIHKVKAGDRAGQLTFLAISAQAVSVKDRRGRTFNLTLPADT